MKELNWTKVVQLLLAQERRIAGYLARQEIERLLAPLRDDPTRLEPFGFKVYSQNDEDGIIEEIFKRLGIVTGGTFCEIGVENGLECNSLWLLHKGWRGSWIEGNKAQQEAITNKFRDVLQSGRLKLLLGFVTKDNINTLFSALGIEKDSLDFLSIDIDGNDIYILESMDIMPKVICIEYNAKWPSTVPVQQCYNEKHQWRGTDYMGSNLKAITTVAHRKGYQLVGTNLSGCNAFFVRKDLVKPDLWPEPDVAQLENAVRYWLFLDHYGNIGHPADFGKFVGLYEERESKPSA